MAFIALTCLIFTRCTEEKYITDEGNLVPKTADHDPSVPSILIDGVRLHAQAFGHPDSNLILCLHGGPGSDYRYMLHCKDLANYGYRVIFFDQIGTGLSQRFPKSYYTSQGLGGLNLQYEQVKSVINYYKTKPDQKVYLLGHSWGGMLATAFTGKYPDMVQGLIIGEAGGLKWADIKEYIIRSQSFKYWGELLNNATYLDQFISGYENQHAILDYKLTMLSSRNDITAEYNTDAEGIWRNGAVVNSALLEIGEKYSPDLSAGIQNFHHKVLFFHSEYNKAYPLSWARHISSVYNSVELYKVPGVGHSGMITDTYTWKETTLPKIVSYLKSL